MNKRRYNWFAIVVSALVHAVLILQFALNHRPGNSPSPAGDGALAPIPLELSLPLAEMIQIEETDKQEPPKADPEPEPDRYIRTTENQKSAGAPDNPEFVSDRDTAAATREAPSTEGAENRPTITDDIELPTYDVESREYRDGPLEDESPSIQRTAASSPSAPRHASPTISTIPDEYPDTPEAIPILPPKGLLKTLEELENADVTEWERKSIHHLDPLDPQDLTDEQRELVLNAAPGMMNDNAISSVPVPPRTEKTFQPHTRPMSMKGTLSNRGSPSFDAKDTPVGRYMKQITDAISKKWHRNVRIHADFVSYGSLRVKFKVNRSGTPESLRVVRKNANAVVEDFTLRSILDAEIPEMPEEVRELMGDGKMPIVYDVLIY